MVRRNMTDISLYRKQTIEVIRDYLNGTITDTEASDWALDVIVKTKNLEELSTSVVSAIQCLADLHDRGESWQPSRNELEAWKTRLEEEA
ncbi:MAG: hypothetical protein ACYS29_05375 [Planctomycetota bacterium]